MIEIYLSRGFFYLENFYYLCNMKQFKLTTKSGEVIAKLKVHNLTLAIEVFARVKQLSKEDLLKIYEVKEC